MLSLLVKYSLLIVLIHMRTVSDVGLCVCASVCRAQPRAVLKTNRDAVWDVD